MDDHGTKTSEPRASTGEKAATGAAKGFFGKIGLPVSKSYLHPIDRNFLLRWGGFTALAVGALLLVNLVFLRGSLVSNGPLSSSHAGFEGDCENCHTFLDSATDEKCSVCHERFGAAVDTHSFDAHYIYRSADFTRAYRRDGEMTCSGCHLEHRGREAAITRIDDSRCVVCHDYGSIQGHPQFQFAAESIPDDDSLHFAHIRHVRRIQEEDKVDDQEQTCFQCHVLTADGRNFEPIDFERSCNRCHLGASPQIRSANFPVSQGPIPADGDDLNLGVESWETVRDRQGPGDQWALFANPAEFRVRGNRVMKTRLRHRDPWVLHNLRRLRRALYPGAGLADLLDASSDVTPGDSEVLYREAVATLQDYSEGLRSRADSEMAKQLEQIDGLLEALQQKLRSEPPPLDDTPFLLPAAPDAELTPAQLEEIDQLVADLTEQCRICHKVEKATIARVSKDQRVLRRAEFNHSAHVIQRRCLDCHGVIPFDDHPDEPPPADAPFDSASVQNLPTVEVCRECHQPQQSSERCSTCHKFHPGSVARTLLPYSGG